jgi:alpha-L-rhamnosidase
MKINTFNFKKALPVWQDGAEKVMNRTLLFRYSLDGTFKNDCSLSIAASSSFIVSVNGNIIAKGPARCAHGYYMVDTYSLDSLLEASENLIEIKVSGYNVNSFEYLNQPSFICAEITSKGNVIAYTDEACTGFIPYVYTDRIEKVQRYSFQRAFTEAYRLGGKELPIAKLSVYKEKSFIERDIPYGDYTHLYPSDKIEKGHFTYSDKERYYNSREICGISDIFFGYRPEELEFASHINVGKMDFTPTDLNCALSFPLTLKSENYIDLDMKKNYTGLISIELECLSDGILYLLFDEIKNDGILNPFRLGCSNIVSLCCSKGSYSLVTEEAYVMQYLRLCASGGDFIIKDVHLIEIAFPESKISARFISDDTEMKKIYDAAKESFKANTVDIFMDCPSRERAGWLCDSFFTARCESVLTGEFSVEKAFLRNFILPDKFEFIPSGMLPMCYPSDHNDGAFISQWAMWYVLELEEYLERSGDRALIDLAKDRMLALYRFFTAYENENGDR